MKKMWITLTALLCLWAVALPTLAQDAPPPKNLRDMPSPENTARRLAGEMKKVLNLSDKQYDKVYSLYYKTEKKLLKQSSQNGGMRPPMHGGMGGPPPQGGGPMGGHFGGTPPQGGFAPGPDGGAPPPAGISSSMKKMAEQRAESQKKTDKKLKKILSEQQYADWQVHQAEQLKQRDKERNRDREPKQ